MPQKSATIIETPIDPTPFKNSGLKRVTTFKPTKMFKDEDFGRRFQESLEVLNRLARLDKLTKKQIKERDEAYRIVELGQKLWLKDDTFISTEGDYLRTRLKPLFDMPELKRTRWAEFYYYHLTRCYSIFDSVSDKFPSRIANQRHKKKYQYLMTTVDYSVVTAALEISRSTLESYLTIAKRAEAFRVIGRMKNNQYVYALGFRIFNDKIEPYGVASRLFLNRKKLLAIIKNLPK